MDIWEYVFRLMDDKRYRITVKAVISLILNLLFAFYNGILGAQSSSLIFVASAVYYFLLCIMRFSVVMLERKGTASHQANTLVGILLIILSIVFQSMVIISMKFRTAAVYGTVPMITIATFTFTKITMAVITAVKHRKDPSGFHRAVNTVRYCEVAVSLLTMQQSMLVSFGSENDTSAIILNACTGAGVCFFIMAMGILTLKNNRKEEKHGKVQNHSGK